MKYFESTRRATEDVVGRLWPDREDAGGGAGPSVRLLDFDPDGEDKVIAAMCLPMSQLPESELLRRVRWLGTEDKRAIVSAYVGEIGNRRHKPGRAFERTGYRFEIVSDYGAFRDLQRHRMLTIEWQRLSPSLGASVPEIVVEAGLEDQFATSLERSASLYADLHQHFPEQAPYALALAFRIRYVVQLDAREAMHVAELRSAPQGHASYRKVAQEMHRLIAEQAGHRVLAESMEFVDHGDHDLERLGAERLREERRAHRGAPSDDGTRRLRT